MYLPSNSSRIRLREAQNARNNRAEIVKALSHGQITRRDLLRWGIFTASGALALKNGLSPFASSAFADVPTGTPPSPRFDSVPFSYPMHRLDLYQPLPLQKVSVAGSNELQWPSSSGERWNSKRLSWHTDFSYTQSNGNPNGTNPYRNPLTNVGPMEGRPPGEYFAQQRWDEFLPQVGYVMSLGQITPGTAFAPGLQPQEPNAVWTFGRGRFSRGTLPPPLIKMRYGEPAVVRIYNNLPINREDNGGFGRNEAATHNHNAHNGSSSDGASNAYHFPGTFYDYHWGTTLARHDTLNTSASDPRASGPDGNGGLRRVRGDYREIQGSLWFHDHRFFFTAENVYKGHLGAINYYSGPDRGNETLNDGVNLRLPSGSLLDWGNLDFDVNLVIADCAFDQQGQYFFDIFDTDGFLGDMIHVNFAYDPFLEVLPRKYRFRLLNACMSRFLKLAIVDESGKRVPFQFIANDGNLVVAPITLNELDQQGVAERYDIVVDFSGFPIGSRLHMVNLLEFSNGRRPDGVAKLKDALNQNSKDPAVGAFLQFRIAGSVRSVDVPGLTHYATQPDRSQVPPVLTAQIPIVTPVRERVVEWKRGGGDSRDTPTGNCIPDCGDREEFPWSVRVNGEKAHALNANRVSLLIPQPGEVEHWTYVNSSGGWDHPIHLHFEEGVTINRGRDPIPATEYRVRKDVWRLGRGGEVKFQVQFGEYGGAYVNHCHNTVHEDAAMLLRYDILTKEGGAGSQTHVTIIPTPIPSPSGVTYMTPEILAEGDPRTQSVSAGPETSPDPGNPVAPVEAANTGRRGRGRGRGGRNG